ncbi:MAG: protein phosphatase 2C domain-containing protein [Alphaproteobacteria bacterium]|nr:protein phosphatase 2C domain-containing protein [Alphaproteobacteria bacterium]
MRPIADPTTLQAGTTLYHSAFGFAEVARVEDEAVVLRWEREGAHLPSQVRFDNLQRVYSQCSAEGFFHRALHDVDVLKQTLLERPAEALAWLLEDLAQPQRLRDVMDWLVGRELFTAKTFVRWWGTAEAAVKADARLSVEGEWLALRDRPSDPLVQLAPDEVEAEAELELAGDLLELERTDPPTDTPSAFATPRPVPLGEVRPPASSLPEIGLALARALAARHAAGGLAHPHGGATLLHPDGTVTFGEGAPSAAPWAESPSPAGDVREAAVLLLEAFTGRAVPPGAEPSDLLPHLRHRLPELAPSVLAPLTAGLALLDQRPDATAWLATWEAVQQAELDRPGALDRGAHLRLAYDSHIGRAKLLLSQVNQDAVWVGTRGPHALAVVADGISISDAGRGEEASWIAAQTISRLWQAVPVARTSMHKLLDRALHLANRRICERSLQAAGGDLTGRMPMGTTITVAACWGNHVHLAWLGDSRAYLLGPWGISQLTADDNVSGERYLAWCAARADGWSPDGHALVRYLGHLDLREGGLVPAPFPAHHAELVLRPGERLVLTSDGVTDYLDVHESGIAAQLHQLGTTPDAYDAAMALVARANRTGGGDNATAVVLEIAR